MSDKQKEAPLAQLVEHLTLNQGVQGSNPWRRIKYRFWRHMSSGVGAFFVLRIESGASELERNWFVDETIAPKGFCNIATLTVTSTGEESEKNKLT